MPYIPPTRAILDRLGEEARQPWREHAACQGRPDLIQGGPGEQKRKQLCLTRCPVLADCRAWVLSLPYGVDTREIIGGLTSGERQGIRARATYHENVRADQPGTRPTTENGTNPE